MKEYEFIFDSDFGDYMGLIKAPDEETFFKKIRNQYPHDIGSDGCFYCPETGDEKPIDWGI